MVLWQAKLEARQPAYGFGGTLSAERHEAAALMESCERYAAEARRLLHTQGAGRTADAFTETKQKLELALDVRQ